ncbi:hypothetical protein [Hymenobacter sp. B81]|uniref:hypothetical protein n=1 Tax=Hymenobacter sp. B81 TaxID=3344878 RepID=UPI0037DCE239
MSIALIPTVQDPDWKAFRARVIAAITDAEVLMQQRGRGINCVVLTEEVAEQLGLVLDTTAAYERLLTLVRATRSIAQESLRCTREQHGGQFALLLL